VSGFMTEHAAVIFVFFFLAEYASIVLMCVLTSVLFLGGYLYNYIDLVYFLQFIDFDYYLELITRESKSSPSNPLLQGLYNGLSLGLKSLTMIFIFI